MDNVAVMPTSEGVILVDDKFAPATRPKSSFTRTLGPTWREGSGRGLPRVTFTDETQLFLGAGKCARSIWGAATPNGGVVIYFPEERVLHTGDLQQYVDVVIPGHGPVSKNASNSRGGPHLRL